jgi:hypothetical protein
MAIDLEKIRALHTELSSSKTGGDFINNFYQIVEGTNTVRILPAAEEGHDFYAATKIHRVPYAEGQVKNIHCRKVHGEACPVCDLYFGLWKTGRKEDEDLARQIKARDRYYMNVVDRETSEVKILSVGIILFKKMISAILDEDFGDITDLESGHDFKIIMYKEGQWPKYDQSQPRPKSEAAGSAADVASWMEQLHEIQSLVKLEDYEELKTISESLAVEGTLGAVQQRTDVASNPATNDEYLERLKTS